jgi:23S rRNA (uracil1939-C5)-methyltransferase
MQELGNGEASGLRSRPRRRADLLDKGSDLGKPPSRVKDRMDRMDQVRTPEGASNAKNVYRRLTRAPKPEQTQPKTFNPGAPRQACSVADSCQGCPLINLPYNRQIDMKKAQFAELLTRAGLNPNVRVGSFESSPVKLNYRQTVKLAVATPDRGSRGFSGPRSEPARRSLDSAAPSNSPNSLSSFNWLNIGLYRPGTHDVFDIGACPAQDKEVNEIVRTIRYALKDNQIPIHKQIVTTRTGRNGEQSSARIVTRGLRYIIVRRTYSDSQFLVTFVSSLDALAKFKVVARQIKQRHSNLVGVCLHLNASTGNAILDFDEGGTGESPTQVLLGSETLIDSLAGVNLEIHPLSFYQVNPPVAERIYRRIWELVDVKALESWLDIYCGIGTIGIGIARQCAQVIGIEENRASLEHAKRNAELNNAGNWHGLAGRAEDVMQEGKQLDALLAGKPLGVVTLNPSRRGCQPKVLERVAALSPRQIVYMSCSAATLFRDLAKLEQLGYETRLLENFDMFPGTPHYETLAVMTRRS